jgi:hypothetical protein
VLSSQGQLENYQIMISYHSIKKRIQAVTIADLLIATIAVSSTWGTLFPLKASFLSNKRNFLNDVFVKNGWVSFPNRGLD